MVKKEGKEGKVAGLISPTNKKLTNKQLKFADKKKYESLYKFET